MATSVAIEDPVFGRMVDALQKALKNLDKHSSVIQRTSERLQTAKDIQRAKEKLKATMETAGADIGQVHDTLAMLGKYLKIHPESRASSQTMSSDARASVQRFEEIHASFWSKAIAAEKRLNDAEDGEESGEHSPLRRDVTVVGDTEMQQQVLALASKEAFEQNLHDEIMAERQREVREIADNLQDIREIFVQLNEMVGEQQVKIDVMENNVTSAEAKTAKGVEELERARDAMQARRKRTFFLGALFLFGFTVIVAVAVSR